MQLAGPAMKKVWAFAFTETGADIEPISGESAIKQRIFEKFMRRLAEIRDMPFCPELNPDVIVISTDQSFLFEPQNPRASELLRRCCAVDAEGIQVRERVRVHPCQSRKIIDNLRTAGLHVVC